jgi:hypothetical protein
VDTPLQSLEDLSSEERLALSYCAPRGIPLSVFFGRVVGLGDQQWTQRDAQAAVLWELDQKAHCPGCGQPRDECMGPEIDDDAPEYEVTSTRCWACEARDKKLKEFQEEGGSGAGLYLMVTKAG